MKTLLQINSVVNSGSTGRIAENIDQLAINKGWKSYIAHGRNNRPNKSNNIRVGSDWDMKLHGIQTRIFDNHSFSSKKATKDLIKIIKEIKPSVIHLHNLHGYYINIEVLFDFLSSVNIPIIWTLHDCWPFTGHCTHFTFVDCDKWKTQCSSCPQKNSYPTSLLIDNSKNNFTRKKLLFNSVSNITLVPVSYWLGDMLKESFLNEYPIEVVQNGIDLGAFTYKDDGFINYNLSDKFIVIGVAGVWNQRKGLEDFIELAKKLQNDEVILLIGLTQKQIKKLPKNIIGIQKTESIEELAEFYSKADVFINPTYEDNFPTTNLEALACGTPVITYETGGSVESVDNNVGWIVKQGDTNDLIKIIRKMKKEPLEIKEKRSGNCREKAEKLYNKNDRFEDYFKLYEKLLIN